MLTVNQVADKLGVTPSLVRRFCRDGRLKAQKIGRDWLIDKRSLDSFSGKPRKAGRPYVR